jgi:myo-inositol-1(or 4)-monophosphatase
MHSPLCSNFKTWYGGHNDHNLAIESTAMEQEFSILSDAMLRAGREALRLATAGFETHTKQDQSPVTSADLAVNLILQQSLLTAFPEDGWLSEESPDATDRLKRKRVWIVDPIDGTRSFVKGRPEFCVSVALVEQHIPTLAAIYNPSTGEFFSALRGHGLRVDRRPDATHPPFSSTHHPLALVNPWELRVGHLRTLESHMRCHPIGSIAYAMALVAAGKAETALTLEGGNEWDVAAGVLLIEESGGHVTAASGEPFSFNRPDPRLHGILALGSNLSASVQSRLVQFSTSAAASHRTS